jgi:hypothetical protein
MSHYLQLADKALGTAAARAKIKKSQEGSEEEQNGLPEGPQET